MSEIQITLKLFGHDEGSVNDVSVSSQVVVSSFSVEILYSTPALDYLVS